MGNIARGWRLWRLGALIVVLFAPLVAVATGGGMQATPAWAAPDDERCIPQFARQPAISAAAHAIALSPDGAQAYVIDRLNPAVRVIDTAADTVTRTIPITGAPADVLATADGQFLYVADGIGSVLRIRLSDGSIVDTIATGAGPSGLQISPDGTTLYAGHGGEALVSMIDTATSTVIADIPGAGPSDHIVLSRDGARLYMTDFVTPALIAVDTAARAIISAFPLEQYSVGPALSADGTVVYVPGNATDTVNVIDPATGDTIASIPVGDAPFPPTVSPDGRYLYVPIFTGGAVDVIDLSDNTVIATIPGLSYPNQIRVLPDGSRMYVAASNSYRVYPITITQCRTVAFHPNGGDGAMPPQTALAPTPLSANAFTRENHTFLRWNTAADGSGESYTEGATYPFTADITLYAQWEASPGPTPTPTPTPTNCPTATPSPTEPTPPPSTAEPTPSPPDPTPGQDGPPCGSAQDDNQLAATGTPHTGTWLLAALTALLAGAALTAIGLRSRQCP